MLRLRGGRFGNQILSSVGTAVAWATHWFTGLPPLPGDNGHAVDAPELDGLDAATKLVVSQLAQVVRGIARDRAAPCSWRGLPQVSGDCACFAGWTGSAWTGSPVRSSTRSAAISATSFSSLRSSTP